MKKFNIILLIIFLISLLSVNVFAINSSDVIEWWNFTTINPSVGMVGRYNLSNYTNSITPNGKGGNATIIGQATAQKMITNFSSVLTTNVSFVVWVNVTDNTYNDFNTLFGMGLGSSGSYWHLRKGASASYDLQVCNAGCSNIAFSNVYFTTNRFVLVAVTKAGSDWKVWVNSTNIANLTKTTPATTVNFGLGRIIDNGAESSGASYSNFGYFNITLSQAELAELYNNGAGLFYPFTTPPSISNVTNIAFQSSTPTNGTTLIYPNTWINIVTNATNFGGNTNTTIYLYNSTKSLNQSRSNLTSGNMIIYNQSFNLLHPAVYYYNASATNNTFINWTELRNITVISLQNLTYQSKTPISNINLYYLNDDNFTVNITANLFNSTIVNITHRLYNSTGGLLQTNSNIGNSFEITYDNLSVGTYYYNATATDGIVSNYSETRNITIYNITQNGFITPTNNQNVSNKRLFVNWSASNTNPSTAITFSYNISLYNSTGSYLRTINTTSTTNYQITDLYSYLLPLGSYYLNLTSIDSNNNKVHQITSFNMLTNTLLNITANGIGVGAISNFTINAYNTQTGYNITNSTTNGYLEIDHNQGIINLTIDAIDYAISENNYATINVSGVNYTYQFSLYQTNVFNITFYNEQNPTVKLSGVNISLEIISDLYSNNYTTNNGSLYIPLLVPETYIMRYSSPGYVTRFYEFTLVNRSYNVINLYLINSSNAYNFTVYIVNEVLNPVEGAVVKNLKYNLANNTYILQEIAITDIQGKAKFTVTFNDEFYKQMVEYNGILRKTTEPDYIDTSSITIPISLLDINIIEDLINYDGINGILTFNNATNNFRFDWSDSSLIASQYCMKTYQMVNSSQNLIETNCETGASSGVILQNVTNGSGLIYYSIITYTESGVNKYLTSMYYEYPSSLTEKPLGNKYGLFIQFILTMGMTSLAVLNLPFAMILAPFTLIIGKILGWNVFSWAGLLAIQAVGFILAIMASMRR